MSKGEFVASDFDEVKRIIENSELKSIEHHEISASRSGFSADAAEPGNLTIEVQQRFGETDFGIRLNARVVLPIGEATASVAGEYSLTNGITPSRRALQLFANEVAVMTILPFLRESIATVTTKVFGAPVFLPLAERGEIALSVDE